MQLHGHVHAYERTYPMAYYQRVQDGPMVGAGPEVLCRPSRAPWRHNRGWHSCRHGLLADFEACCLLPVCNVAPLSLTAAQYITIGDAGNIEGLYKVGKAVKRRDTF